jgi:hypothetical protein
LASTRKCILSAALTIFIAISGICFAEESGPSTLDLGKRAAQQSTKAATTRSAAGAGGSYVRTVLAKDVVVKPKETVQFELDGDIGGAEQVVISATSLGDSNLSKVRFVTAFAGPDEWYVASNVTSGNTFAFTDHGAITVQVAGPGVKVAVVNDDTVAITIRQLSVYAAGR